MGGVQLIRPVSYADLMQSPEFPALIAEYGAECSIPEIGPINPQPDLYALMERTGMLQCFGAHEGGSLIGFVSVQTFPLPHYGRKVANIESLFVPVAHRKSAIGFELLDRARMYGKEQGCAAILYNTPVGSVFERVLNARKQARRTNSVFCEAL